MFNTYIINYRMGFKKKTRLFIMENFPELLNPKVEKNFK